MIAGIICELNPLHHGHTHLFTALRRQGAETIVCAMSGHFVQRGELSLLNKCSRAEMAVCCGADLVLELPTPWAMATAEVFAQGGVQLLTMAQCTHLAFGSECGALSALQRAASSLDSASVQQTLREHLSGGVTFAAARQQALETVLGEEAAYLSNPNDTLAVEYLRALTRTASPMLPIAVPRIGAAHDGAVTDGMASASHIRALVRQDGDATPFMPAAAWEIMRREQAAGRTADMARIERSVLAGLRQMAENTFAPYDGGGEGLYHRVYDAVHSAATLEEVLSAAKTKRYTAARLRRLVLAAWLGLETPPPQPPYLRVLAANEQGRQHLAALRHTAPMLTKPADVGLLGAAALALFQAEARRTDLYTLAYSDLHQSRPDSDWRATPVIR